MITGENIIKTLPPFSFLWTGIDGTEKDSQFEKLNYFFARKKWYNTNKSYIKFLSLSLPISKSLFSHLIDQIQLIWK